MFNINGIDWQIIVVSANHPILQNKLGVCVADAHQIYLSDKIPNYKFKKVLCHEITHAAMFSYGVYMTLDQEELIADLIATYGEEIIEVTNGIFNKIRGK